jgi:hypothetical protein
VIVAAVTLQPSFATGCSRPVMSKSVSRCLAAAIDSAALLPTLLPPAIAATDSTEPDVPVGDMGSMCRTVRAGTQRPMRRSRSISRAQLRGFGMASHRPQLVQTEDPDDALIQLSPQRAGRRDRVPSPRLQRLSSAKPHPLSLHSRIPVPYQGRISKSLPRCPTTHRDAANLKHERSHPPSRGLFGLRKLD